MSDFSAEGLARLSPDAPGPKAVLTVPLLGLLPSDVARIPAQPDAACETATGPSSRFGSFVAS
jgi:hypothetical protein